jgi:HNH endonuclease/NUMOD4 motif
VTTPEMAANAAAPAAAPAFERWRPVRGYRFYEVSDRGRVVTRRGRVRFLAQRMRGQPNRRYPAVDLYRDGVRHTRSVHSLVLEAFVGPRPPGTEICHWNDDPTDNTLANLRYDTKSANEQDKTRNRTQRALAVFASWNAEPPKGQAA